MGRRIRVNGVIYEAVLGEGYDTILYGNRFSLDNPVLDRDRAQDYLDDDRQMMLREFNDEIDADDSPLVGWRWFLTGDDTGLMLFESSRELTKGELTRLGRAISEQISEGLGDGFVHRDFSGFGTESVSTFSKRGYVPKRMSDSYRKYL